MALYKSIYLLTYLEEKSPGNPLIDPGLSGRWPLKRCVCVCVCVCDVYVVYIYIYIYIYTLPEESHHLLTMTFVCQCIYKFSVYSCFVIFSV